jgi:hypothetical protein
MPDRLSELTDRIRARADVLVAESAESGDAAARDILRGEFFNPIDDIWVAAHFGNVALDLREVCDRLNKAQRECDAFWNEIRDRHADESKRLAHCRAISLTSCQCGYLQRVKREASNG